MLTARVEATEWIEISGCSVLSVCSGPNGMVGTSSACTESAATICEEDTVFTVDVESVAS